LAEELSTIMPRSTAPVSGRAQIRWSRLIVGSIEALGTVNGRRSATDSTVSRARPQPRQNSPLRKRGPMRAQRIMMTVWALAMTIVVISAAVWGIRQLKEARAIG
jgi:hypothetical protein